MKFQPVPKFPAFRLLSLDDQFLFKQKLKRILSYSDFNFVSLWSYNTEEDLQISQLNNNLVLKVRDYITNEQTLTYIGNIQPVKTISSLIEYAKEKKLTPTLKMIPLFNISKERKLLKQHFHILTDRDNYDYVLSINDLASMPGSGFANKRNKFVRFIKDYPTATLQEVNLTISHNHNYLLKIFSKWGESRKPDEIAHEYKAVKRILKDSDQFKLICFGVYIDQKLEAFTIIELLPRKYAITHFTKADPKKIGIFEFLYHETAKELLNKGVRYLNREQDLGLEGLRNGKMSWRPIRFLKKYTLSQLLNK